MERTYANQQEAMEVAKEAMWLAYQASVPMGLGFFHVTDKLTKDDIVKETFRDESGGYADYCHGRMMKTHFGIHGPVLSCNDDASGDYQSWARRYNNSYSALVDAAEKTILKQTGA